MKETKKTKDQLIKELQEKIEKLEAVEVQRKNTEEELRKSEERFRRLADNARDIIYRISLPNGNYEYVSPASEAIIGYSPEELYETPKLIEKIIHPDWREYLGQKWEDLIQGEVESEYEYKIITKSGEEKWLNQRNMAVYDDDGKLIALEGIVTDITNRKKNEEELRKNEIMFRQASKVAHIGVWEIDLVNDKLNFSDELIRIHGVTKPLEKSDDIWDLAYPEDIPKIQKAFDAALTGEEPYNITHRIVRQINGEIRWVHALAEVDFDEAGSAIRIYGVVRDITDKKIAEETMKKNKERLELAMDASDHGFWDWNIDTGETYFSPRYYTMLGYEPGEFPMELGAWEILLHPDDREIIAPNILEKVKNTEPFEAEFRLKTKSGGWKWIRGKGKSYDVDENGAPHRAIGTHEDITEQKKAQKALRESEEKYRLLAETASDIICIHDMNGVIKYLNRAAQEIMGDKSEILGRKVQEFISQEEMSELYERRASRFHDDGSIYLYNVELLRKNGQRIPVEISSAPIKKEGKVEDILIIARDIRERINAENALRESEKKHRLLFEEAGEGILYLDDNGIIKDVNPKILEMLEISKDEIVHKNFRQLDDMLVFDKAQATVGFLELMKSNQYIRQAEWEIVTPADKRLILETNARALQSEGDNVGVVIFVRDITERKRAEKALIQSEEKFRTIFENAPVMIDSFDENGQCMLWNEECENVLGWTRQEMFLADDPLSLIAADEEMGLAARDAIRRSDGIFREYEVVAKDGTRRQQRWADFRLPNGEIISVGYDITERKKAEERLKRSLKEKELLLQEIHHRVRNNLQVISGLLNMHIRQSEHPPLQDSLSIVNNRIQAIAYVHHNLYKSDDFSKVNFENFVRDLSIHLLDTFGVYGAIDIIVDAEDIALGIENAVPCALIVNELITNSIKHAFPDNSGKIIVSLRTLNSHLGLHVIDNGIGLPEEIDFQHPNSTGLNIVRLLVKQLNGEIEVSRDNGTDVTITFMDN